MFDRLISERNYIPSNNEEVASPMDPNSPEFSEMNFLFNTMFNESAGRFSSNDSYTYEVEKAFSLTNQYISLNFEKREANEVTSYGWYESDNYDDKKLDGQAFHLKTKGLEKIKGEIKVSGPPNKDPEIYIIIVCKFIVGKSEVIFQDQELTEKDKEKYKANFDTVVRLLTKSSSKENVKSYNVLREENIALLYLIKAKRTEFKIQKIECSGLACPNNELNTDLNKKESPADKNMYYCLLKEDYLCNTCHNDYHATEILYGNFDVSRCEQKTSLNLKGECPNKEFHPNKKSFDIDYFCTDCLKGICSYCKVYGNEKHPNLEIITDVFNRSKSKEKEKDKNQFDKSILLLNNKIMARQLENKNTGGKLKKFLTDHARLLHKQLDNKFTEEGEKLVSICYQLNFLKDNLIFYHRAYLNKENLCINNNLKQELFWTKKTHIEHLLYLISIKDNIQTDYVVDKKEFEKIIDIFKDDVEKRINQDYGVVKHVEIKKEKEKEESVITYENLMNITGLSKEENNA